MTRRGLERERVRVVIAMMRGGASFGEALAYCDLILPFGEE